MPARLAIACLLTLFATSAFADATHLQSKSERVLLLELYTSEGCSSCPPADRWLSNLGEDPRLWHDLVPVAFHVDYWDYIGWPDRFAEADYGERHRRYARQGHIDNVYTPGLVVAGNEWRAWFRHPVLEPPPAVEVGQLALEVEVDVGGGGAAVQLVARYEPAFSLPREAELHVAMLGFDLSTEVLSGENHGRRLEHDFVVLSYATLPMRSEQGGLVASGPLPTSDLDETPRAIAAWVSLTGDQRPIQAVGGWLQD